MYRKREKNGPNRLLSIQIRSLLFLQLIYRVYSIRLQSFVIVGSIVRHGSSRAGGTYESRANKRAPCSRIKQCFYGLPTTNSVSLVSIKQWSRSPSVHDDPRHLSPSLSLSASFSPRLDRCRWQCINQEDDCTHQRRCIEWSRGRRDEEKGTGGPEEYEGGGQGPHDPGPNCIRRNTVQPSSHCGGDP